MIKSQARLKFVHFFIYCLFLHYRTQAMALLATMLLFGAAVSPWVSNALRLAHLQLPFIVLSVLCFGNVILSFILKETKGLVLEEVLTKGNKCLSFLFFGKEKTLFNIV